MNPPHWSTGNAILETAMACAYETILNGRSADKYFLLERQHAFSQCQNKDLSFNKNPGRTAQITHDDLKALACVSRLCGMPFAQDIVNFGTLNKWCLSNTSHMYWDAIAKPWDKNLYLMCTGKLGDIFEYWSMLVGVVVDAYFGSASDHRIVWLMSVAIGEFDTWTKIAFGIWKKRMRKQYVTVGSLQYDYYEAGSQDHPYVKYGKIISF